MQNYWTIREKIENANESCQTGTEDDFSASRGTSRLDLPSDTSTLNLQSNSTNHSLKKRILPVPKNVFVESPSPQPILTIEDIVMQGSQSQSSNSTNQKNVIIAENVFQESAHSSKSMRDKEESGTLSYKNKKKISFTDSFADQGMGGERRHKPSQAEEGLIEELESRKSVRSEKKATGDGAKVIRIGSDIFSLKQSGKVNFKIL